MQEEEQEPFLAQTAAKLLFAPRARHDVFSFYYPRVCLWQPLLVHLPMVRVQRKKCQVHWQQQEQGLARDVLRRPFQELAPTQQQLFYAFDCAFPDEQLQQQVLLRGKKQGLGLTKLMKKKVASGMGNHRLLLPFPLRRCLLQKVSCLQPPAKMFDEQGLVQQDREVRHLLQQVY